MLPPGPSAPSVVQMFQWMRSPAGQLEKLAARFGDVFTTRTPLFGTAVNFSHPDALKQIFLGDPAIFHAGEVNQLLGAFVGLRSVLVLDEAPHLHLRRLMLPAFHGDRMRHYTKGMREATRRAVESLGPGQQLGLHTFFQSVTLDVILRAVLGLDEGPSFEATRTQLMKGLTLIQSPTGMLWAMPALQKNLGPLTPWAKIERELAAIDELLFEHIAAHRRGEGDPNDVLSRLIQAVDEEGRRLDDKTLRDQLMTLLVAGHETSATTLAWVFEELLRVEGGQDLLIGEASRVLGGAPVDAEDLPRLELIDSAIKEALRLHPVTGATARKLKAPATIGGHELPAGVMAIAALHLTHRRPELYPDPDRFIVDRFVGKKIDPYAWAPFGGGVRRCLGMAFALHEMKVILATLFGTGIRFALQKPGPYKTTMRAIVYAPKGGTQVVVEAMGPLPAPVE